VGVGVGGGGGRRKNVYVCTSVWQKRERRRKSEKCKGKKKKFEDSSSKERKKKLLLRQFADDTNQCAVLVAHFANIWTQKLRNFIGFLFPDVIGCLCGVGSQFGDDPCEGAVLRFQFLVLGFQFLQLLRDRHTDTSTYISDPLSLIYIHFGSNKENPIYRHLIRSLVHRKNCRTN